MSYVLSLTLNIVLTYMFLIVHIVWTALVLPLQETVVGYWLGERGQVQPRGVQHPARRRSAARRLGVASQHPPQDRARPAQQSVSFPGLWYIYIAYIPVSIDCMPLFHIRLIGTNYLLQIAESADASAPNARRCRTSHQKPGSHFQVSIY